MHPTLAGGRWSTYTLVEQLAHIGSEVDRALYWSAKNDSASAQRAIDRALELIDLTISDSRWAGRRKELLRTREVLADRFYGENEYQTTDEFLKKYFLAFGFAAARNR